MSENLLYNKLFEFFTPKTARGYKTNLGYCYLYGIFTHKDVAKGIQILTDNGFDKNAYLSREKWLLQLLRYPPVCIKERLGQYALCFSQSFLHQRDGFPYSPYLVDYCLSFAVKKGTKVEYKILEDWQQRSSTNIFKLYLDAVRLYGKKNCPIQLLNKLISAFADASPATATFISELYLNLEAYAQAEQWKKRALTMAPLKQFQRELGQFYYNLGMQLYFDKGTPGQALIWLEKAFLVDSVFSMSRYNSLVNLWRNIENNRLLDPKCTKGIQLEEVYLYDIYLHKRSFLSSWKKLADSGSILAHNQLGLQFYFRAPTMYNNKIALNHMAKAFSACDREDRGVLLLKAYWEENPYREEIFWWLKLLAYSGWSVAQYCLAAFYGYGIGVEANLCKALYWYQRSAVQNYLPAKMILGK